jgi:serine/threonine-protein kinase
MIPREGSVVADRYRLVRKVGGGSVAATWQVRDEVGEIDCALKLLHPSMCKNAEALTRFTLEDRIARELSGPYFPRRIGAGSWEGTRYLAWQWHDGECLRTLFERNPQQDAPTVNWIVQEACKALTLLHEAGYTHGDLKPENLFFATRGESDPTRQLKLLGFAVASRFVPPPRPGRSSGRRRPGQVVGTPLYMSPDVIEGRVPSGGDADLWALAVIAYEALTGRPPFVGGDLGSVFQAVLDRRAPRPSTLLSSIPGTFDLWWAQALEGEFTTPGQFAVALGRALAPALRSSHTQRSASLPEQPRSLPQPIVAAGANSGGEPVRPQPASGPTASAAASAGDGAIPSAPSSSTRRGNSAQSGSHRRFFRFVTA